ncbi:hypothetical protein TIFTF001_007955 [Ficus carica]|uniref:Uncharacterized protein n=1 Tax=Ficus carica TaxID=3494 RepID=A0AA87ZS64_FICCA|nr:hypothetical protein TIFTF001_007955 [Ficus carica]
MFADELAFSEDGVEMTIASDYFGLKKADNKFCFSIVGRISWSDMPSVLGTC